MTQGTNALKALIILSLLTGCAIVPDVGPAPNPKSFSDYASGNSLAASRKTAWPEGRWWASYGDPQLSRLIENALAKSPTLDEAEAHIRQAEAATQTTESGLYPHIGADGYYRELRQSYNQGLPPGAVPEGTRVNPRAALDLSFDLDFWGKNRVLLAAATSDAEAARLEGEQARLIVSASVARVYADLAQLYANLDAVKDALNVRRQSALLMKKREDNGLENKGSYEQELAEQESAAAEIEGLNEAIALTKNRLAALCGEGPDYALSIERPDIQKLAPFGLPENLPAELLGHRPDVMAARLEAEASSKRIDAAEASFYPNVNLMGFVGHESLGMGYFTSPYSLVAAVGPTVSLPILDGGALRGQYSLRHIK